MDYMSDNLINDVREKISEWISAQSVIPAFFEHSLGKMIRTRFAARLLQSASFSDFPKILNCCVATELVHSATLFHDDVVDGASLRRGSKTVWNEFGINTSILIGDLFFCGAVLFISQTNDSELVGSFVAKIEETCSTEIRQELNLRNTIISNDQSISVARGKTGALFSFIAAACGTVESRAAMEEAGYRVGTAFQLMDDLVDDIGDSETSGKTLGTDRLRNKYTLAQSTGGEGGSIQDEILIHCRTALQLLQPWPEKRSALENFLRLDFPWIDGCVLI